MPRQSRRARRRSARSAPVSTPLQSEPVVGVPGVTGDLVADYGVPVAVEEPEEELRETRFKSRYLAERERPLDEVARRRRTPDHRYVTGEIRRIAITAALMIAILIAATFLLR